MIKITVEARKAARDAALSRWGMGSADTTQMLMCVDAALLAACPHLDGATPVATKQVIADVVVKQYLAGGAHLETALEAGQDIAAALLAAGVFREGATPAIDREALTEAAAKAIHRWDKKPITWHNLLPDDRSQYLSEAEAVVDAVLSLIGRAS